MGRSRFHWELTAGSLQVMNKLIAPFAALAFAFSIATAHADEAAEEASDEAAGKIAAVNASTLILEDGTTFTIGEGVSMEGLEPGTEVTVSYEEQDGTLVATEVAPSGPFLPRDDSRSFNRGRSRKCFSKYGPKISDLKQQKFFILSGVMAAALECPLSCRFRPLYP